MTHWYQVGSALRGHDAGEARHFERISLGVTGQGVNDLGGHGDEGAGVGRTLAGRLGETSTMEARPVSS